MRKIDTDEKLMIIGFIIAIVASIILIRMSNDCDKKGGILVKTAVGWVSCIYEK